MAEKTFGFGDKAKIAAVWWDDAFSVDGNDPHEVDDIGDGRYLLLSAGVLVKITDRYVILARDAVAEATKYRDLLHIPRELVRRMQVMPQDAGRRMRP